MDVTLPDGTRIRASSLLDRVEDDPTRDFGLYLDARWNPTWPSDTIDWVRQNYRVEAVETAEQEHRVSWFGQWADRP